MASRFVPRTVLLTWVGRPLASRTVKTRISQTPGLRSRTVAAGGTVAVVGMMSRETGRVAPSGRPENQGMCTPETARATTKRWISEVPSKIV
jgi:hypothetical protein